jgi:hypothetical protein
MINRYLDVLNIYFSTVGQRSKFKTRIDASVSEDVRRAKIDVVQQDDDDGGDRCRAAS